MSTYIAKFNSRESAFSYASHGHALTVMLGDDCRYWVVTMAYAAKLEKAGYQWA